MSSIHRLLLATLLLAAGSTWAADPKPAAPAPPSDDVKFAGLSAAQAAKEMTLPPGFKATLFAGEPDVVQPIAFCLDDRGRV